ncbi:type VI secretion system ATPase TssH [Flexibacterium corallicola]|uniref:type VI secretion system ATPase TssH n=1 Tax=Flexibacterium corallicola TaxID=3037259 RepID=UPI00286F1297|nr:type VI secretion system ATPase TssH [Pseudovibrio sp. M1P-2-3]
MTRLDIKSLISRLNLCCTKAIEDAASLCVTNSNREVTIEHLLIGLVEQHETDFRLIMKTQDIDPEKFIGAVKATFLRFRRTESDRAPTFSPVLQDILQDAWLITSVELGQAKIRSGAILVALLSDLGRYAPFDYYNNLKDLPTDFVLRKFDDLTAGSIETVQPSHAGLEQQIGAAHAAEHESALSKFGTNFTELARQGEIDPIFCRDQEIRQIIEILCRRRKNNPMCVGEAGVGKTALAEGIALKIVEGDIPPSLADVELWGLDVGALQAGASLKGEFEKRLKAVIEEVKSSPKPIILFIDEAHTLIGAGGDKGGSDAANLLKPALARGELRTIAATTWSEYKLHFEKDPALTRRFQLIKLDEPTVEQAIVILRGLKQAYEKSHGIYISEEAISAAVKLSARYITGRQLPDKAIDVLDTACARVRAGDATQPVLLEELRQEEATLIRERDGLKRDALAVRLDEAQQERLGAIKTRLDVIGERADELEGEFNAQVELVQAYRDERNILMELLDSDEAYSQDLTDSQSKLVELRGQLEKSQTESSLVSVEVGPAEIAAIIGDWTGIPVTSMVEDDYHRLLTLAETMKQTIKGQDHALDKIESRLQASRLDLHKKGQPLGVFLLAGPSGVGKTETALEIARRLFGGEQFITTINMSEYQERHTLSRLIGSPPGYVGYGEGGVLTEAIRKQPYSVVLLDEVEKADPNVLNLFYQAFDKGELADGEGRIIDCRNIVFFLTSNLGSDQIENWFATAEEGKIPSAETMARSLNPLFAQHFKPALLARMEPIVYLPLSDEIMASIVHMRIAGLIELLRENQNITLDVTSEAIESIQKMCGVAANGARLVDQVIQQKLLPSISIEILEAGHKGAHLSEICVDYEGDGVNSFTFAAKVLEEEENSSSPEVALV